MKTFISNLKRAIYDGETVSIGGGVFTPSELQDVLSELQNKTVPNREQMKARAWAISEGMFYSDDECEHAWQPFEDWDDAELCELVGNVANSIFNAMLWAQGDQTDET